MSLQKNWRNLHNNSKHFWAVLNFTNLVEFHKFLEFKLFKFFYNIYMRDWLKLEKKRLTKQDKFMTREKKIKAIQTKIIDEEKHDLRKFSNKTSNKDDWNAMNHLTCFMYNVRHQNFVKFNDFFFDFVFDDAEKNKKIWNLMQYVLKNIVDSKSNRDTNQKSKSEIVDDVMKFVSVSNSQVKIFKFNKNRRNQTLKRHDETIEFENDFIVDLKQFFNLTKEKIIKFNENENSNSSDFDSNNSDFINAEKMTREFYFAIFNIKDRWWKV